MAEITNVTKSRLEAGELALGLGLRQARTADTGKVLRTCGYDWAFIDMEHGMMSIDTATGLAVSCQEAGVTPIVRVPGHESFHASRALDGGAQGIVVPHVNNDGEAAAVVSHCRYPPIGKRSVTGTLPQLDFVTTPAAELTSVVNAATLVVVMIETAEGVDGIEAIAATPGVDVLLIGTSDLCLELGIPGEVEHPRVVEVYERVIAACRANGVHPGMGGVYAPAIMRRYIDMGMRLVLCGSDLSMLMSAASARAEELRSHRVA